MKTIFLFTIFFSTSILADGPVSISPAGSVSVGYNGDEATYGTKLYGVRMGNSDDPIKAHVLGVGVLKDKNSTEMVYSPIQININSIGFSLDFPFKKTKNASMSLNYTFEF